MRMFRRVPFVIAEAGVNHDGDLRLALKLVDAAADCGADAVKFQTFKAELLASPSARKAAYQKERTGGGGQLEMLKKLELGEAAHRKLLARCRARGIEFMSTPFDERSADLLARLGVRRFKLPSGEVTNPFLLAHVARKRRPIILSTGMSTLAEVASAVRTLRTAGCRELALLHCVSSYPADAADANLRAMAALSRRFRVPVGWSDHTPGTAVSVAAAALGAAVIEKHITLDRTRPGPDHAMSLEPAEFKELVSQVRQAAAALGDGRKAPRPCEADVRRAARRSLVLREDLPAGTRLSAAHLAARRPGTGISPMELRRVVGRRLKRATAAGVPLRKEGLA